MRFSQGSASLKMIIHANFLSAGDFDPLVWFLACDQSSLVGLCMQDYKSLCAVFTICSTLINSTPRQTHMHTDSILTSLYEKLSQLS